MSSARVETQDDFLSHLSGDEGLVKAVAAHGLFLSHLSGDEVLTSA